MKLSEKEGKESPGVTLFTNKDARLLGTASPRSEEKGGPLFRNVGPQEGGEDSKIFRSTSRAPSLKKGESQAIWVKKKRGERPSILVASASGPVERGEGEGLRPSQKGGQSTPTP